MNNITKLIKSHVSVRKFIDKEINRQAVDEIIKCAQMASTSNFIQAYTIIEVQDTEKIEFLKRISGNQKIFDTSKLVLLFCGDLHRCDKYFEEMDKNILKNTDLYTVAVVDASLAAQNAMIAAESLGICGTFIGGIRNDVEKIYDEFNLPDMVFPLFAICFGYPEENPGKKERMDQKIIHKINCYDESEDEVLLNKYNDKIREYYTFRTSGRNTNNWIQQCSKNLMSKIRNDVGVVFRNKGLLKF